MKDIQPLYQRIEIAYASRFGTDLTESALTFKPEYQQGKKDYNYENPIQSTHDLATNFLDYAREQTLDAKTKVSDKLVTLYGQLVGFTHELISYRDFNSLTLLLALAHLEPNLEVERALACNQVVVSAMAESVFNYYDDNTTRERASETTLTRIRQIQRYYSIEGGQHHKSLRNDKFLFDRLSKYPQQFRTLSY